MTQAVQLALIAAAAAVLVAAIAFWASVRGVHKIAVEIGALKLSINGHMSRVIEAVEKSARAEAKSDAALQIASAPTKETVVFQSPAPPPPPPPPQPQPQPPPRAARSTDRKPDYGEETP